VLLEAENIKFVSKEENPQNCLELRPIERYWAIVKRNLLKNGSLSQNNIDMKKKLDACSRQGHQGGCAEPDERS